MDKLVQQKLTGERALYGACDIEVVDSIFCDGESPLKQSSNIVLNNCSFQWKYPLWYCHNVKAVDCVWHEMGRAGVWYTNDIVIKNAVVQAPKNFRRCDGIEMENVTMSHAAETLWYCNNVKMKDVTATGDYFAMCSSNMELENFTLDGNYSFDGCSNLTIKNSKLLSKDAFWNTDNVTVIDSYICGEYLGWNSKNLTLINCTIESLQGMCYIDNLVMKNCKLINTTLAFEYCNNMDAEVVNKVDSVFNPGSGKLSVAEIDELIVEKNLVDPTKTVIVCEKINKKSDLPEWKVQK